jgi:nucleotide-binding universal stress UspA family protein
MSDALRRPRIAWLVNLFGDPDAQHAHAAAVLRPLAARLDADVVPVYALEARADALLDVAEAERVPYTHARLRALLGEHDLPAGEPVLADPGTGATLRERVDALVDAVRSVEPLFIAVHTHAYTALDRVFLGSFSEKFFTRSPAPVLVLNPHAAVPAAFDRVLFATDFSRNATDAFGRLLPIARGLGAQVYVEHVLAVRELSLFLSGSATRSQYEAEVEAERERAESGMTPYRVAAEAAGVPAETRVTTENASTPTGEAIEERAADRDTSIVAVAAHGDHQRPGNIGSVALWLMRRAERPVLVFPIASA